MKLNTIHQDLKELYKDKKGVDDLLTFDFTCDNEKERVMNVFRSGYWSVMPFAFGMYNNFAIKLHPKNKINNSSIVQINNSDGVTVGANLKTFLPLVNLDFLNDIKIIKEDFIDNRKEIEEMSLPFRKYTNGLDSLDFFYEYITNPENLDRIEKEGENYHNQTYLDFWNHYNNTQEQKKYSVLIAKLDADEEFYPKYQEIDYGLWNNRAYNVLGQRAYGDLNSEFKNIEKHVWQNLTQTHGFDALDVDFDIIPDPSSNSSSSLRTIIDEFDPNPDLGNSFSKEIVEHPLYEAIQDLRVRQSGYMGEKHIEAAAILDMEHNDPYAAWDALVTASYWAGQAGSKAIEPMWEAAIYLAEKHNWTEIHEVLVQQYEYYNFYKDKV